MALELTNSQLTLNSTVILAQNADLLAKYGTLDVSGAILSVAYIDGSMAKFATNASVGTAFLTNASLGNLSLRVNQLDVSIKNFATNASIATGTVVKEYVVGTDYRIGLKDGSGVNGSLFVKDNSLYIKINNFWTMIACTSIGLGI